MAVYLGPTEKDSLMEHIVYETKHAYVVRDTMGFRVSSKHDDMSSTLFHVKPNKPIYIDYNKQDKGWITICGVAFLIFCILTFGFFVDENIKTSIELFSSVWTAVTGSLLLYFMGIRFNLKRSSSKLELFHKAIERADEITSEEEEIEEYKQIQNSLKT